MNFKVLFVFGIFLSSLLLIHSAAYPCGLCREDYFSSVYSYEAVERAKANPDTLEFMVLKIEGPLPEATLRRLNRWLQKRKGVDATTVKISAHQKSVGFIFEKRFSKDFLMGDLERAFPALNFEVLLHQ